MRVAIDPGAGEKVFRVPIVRLGLSVFATSVVGLVSIGFAVMTMVMWPFSLAMVAVFAALTIFMSGVTGYVIRDLSGKWGLRFVFAPDTVTADLPKGRSAIHRLASEHLVVPYREIAAIETRLEAYRSLGMAMMQQAYVLRRKSGAMTYLFEERALGSGMATSDFGDVVAELRARSGAPLNDLGMVEGRGGFLGVWGTSAPSWSAPSLTPERQSRLWSRVAFTGLLAGSVFVLVMLVRFLASLG